jgi:hypothetical protein
MVEEGERTWQRDAHPEGRGRGVVSGRRPFDQPAFVWGERADGPKRENTT